MKLSVFMLAYNHEPFIEQAIQSVLAQRTAFDFELVVGEDASTDGTAAIVRRYQEAHPDKIRATLRTQNVGMHRNFVESYRACRGEYVAYLDGDDYWTAPDKLQKQVDFLDAHPGYSMCCHKVHVLLEGRGEFQDMRVENSGGVATFEIDDLIVDNFVPSCSAVAHNRLIDAFPDWLPEIGGVDWVFHLLNARHGSIACLQEIMGVYRQHAGGVWSPQGGQVRHERVHALYDRMPSILDRRHRTLARVAGERFRYWAGNEWLRGQVESYKAEVTRLNQSVEWLHGQLDQSVQAWHAGQAWIAELDKQIEGLKRHLDEHQSASARALDEARAESDRLRSVAEENTRLHSRVQEIESSRGWKSLQFARRLVSVLGTKPLGRARQLVAGWSRRPAASLLGPGRGA
jgi:glycosyltransferase involved in cell wall biosynthesis